MSVDLTTEELAHLRSGLPPKVIKRGLKTFVVDRETGEERLVSVASCALDVNGIPKPPPATSRAEMEARVRPHVCRYCGARTVTADHPPVARRSYPSGWRFGECDACADVNARREAVHALVLELVDVDRKTRKSITEFEVEAAMTTMALAWSAQVSSTSEAAPRPWAQITSRTAAAIVEQIMSTRAAAVDARDGVRLCVECERKVPTLSAAGLRGEGSGSAWRCGACVGVRQET